MFFFSFSESAHTKKIPDLLSSLAISDFPDFVVCASII